MNIRIGGVPEHFNYPWHYGLAEGLFAEAGLSIEWQDVGGGSGAMCAMLDSGELDLAVVLTEGVVKHIAQGSGARIVQQYVKSPLIWGIHCSRHFLQRAELDLSKARFARSRKGSGSHIMAYVDAEQKSYTVDESQFVDVGNIEGAITAFEEDRADILLWERFMTQPYVDRGQVHRIAECISPWPCFVLVASEQVVANTDFPMNLLQEKIQEACLKVMADPQSVARIASYYNLELEQVEQWYSMTEWQSSPWVSSRMLENVMKTLKRTEVIDRLLDPASLCHPQTLRY